MNLLLPKSAETADVRTALLSKGLIDDKNCDQKGDDAIRSLELAVEELQKELCYDRATLRRAAVEWVVSILPPPQDDVESVAAAWSDDFLERVTPEKYQVVEPMTGRSKYSEGEVQAESGASTKEARPSVVLGTAGIPDGRPSEAMLATDPIVRKQIREIPNCYPTLSLGFTSSKHRPRLKWFFASANWKDTGRNGPEFTRGMASSAPIPPLAPGGWRARNMSFT